jgi:hypothetical protein
MSTGIPGLRPESACPKGLSKPGHKSAGGCSPGWGFRKKFSKVRKPWSDRIGLPISSYNEKVPMKYKINFENL